MPGSTSPESFDVLISGAGPAGATTALALRESGLKVGLLDKATFPRDKICGDALSGKVVSALKYLDPACHAALLEMPEKLGSWGIRFFAPNRQLLDIPFRSERQATAQAPGFISKRLDFDAFLVDLLRQAPNILLQEGYRVTSIERQGSQLIVSDGQRPLQAPLLIAADGAQSLAAKKLAGHQLDPRHHSAGVRAYFRGVTGFHAENFIELHYLQSLLPGYFWIFPLPNGWANVGLGMLTQDVSQGKVDLKAKLQEVIATEPALKARFAQAEMVDPVRGFGLPLGSKRRKLSGEGFMLTGDAASLIDPFTGEGIGNAMLSGRIAAAQAVACHEAGDFSAAFLQPYDQKVYAKMGRELQLSYQMQKLVRYPWLFNWVVNKANRNSSLRTMMTMMFENLDLRKELSRPGFYWKLLVNG